MPRSAGSSSGRSGSGKAAAVWCIVSVPWPTTSTRRPDNDAAIPKVRNDELETSCARSGVVAQSLVAIIEMASVAAMATGASTRSRRAGTRPLRIGFSTNTYDTIATAVKLATNVGSVTGTVSAKTDVDYYAVTLAAGQTLTVGMTGPSGTDYDLNLVNASGTVLAKSTGSTSTESMSYTATTATTVYVKVFSYSGSSTTSTYKLTITYK